MPTNLSDKTRRGNTLHKNQTSLYGGQLDGTQAPI